MKRHGWMAWVLALVLLSAAVVALLAMPVVRVWDIRLPPDGAAKVAPSELMARLQPFEGQRFLTLPLGVVRRAVVAHPWVADARVVRIWPDRVRIDIALQQPVARWGTRGLVNDRGEVFYPGRLDGYANLLRLDGPEVKDAPALLTMAVWLRQQTALTDWQLTGLVRHAGGSVESQWWPARVLWLDEQHYRAQFSRFLEAWPQVRAPLRQAATAVDLRYSNGFSIRAKLSNGSDEHHGAQKTEQ